MPNGSNGSLGALGIVDPPVGSAVGITVDITNVGDRAGRFYIVGIAGVTTLENPTVDDILDFAGPDAILQAVDATGATTFNIADVEGEGGSADAVVVVEPNETATVEFTTPPLEFVGIYDVAFRAGTLPELGEPNDLTPENIQSEAFLLDAFAIFEPAEGQLGNIQVLGEAGV